MGKGGAHGCGTTHIGSHGAVASGASTSVHCLLLQKLQERRTRRRLQSQKHDGMAVDAARRRHGDLAKQARRNEALRARRTIALAAADTAAGASSPTHVNGGEAAGVTTAAATDDGGHAVVAATGGAPAEAPAHRESIADVFHVVDVEAEPQKAWCSSSLAAEAACTTTSRSMSGTEARPPETIACNGTPMIVETCGGDDGADCGHSRRGGGGGDVVFDYYWIEEEEASDASGGGNGG